MTNLQNNIEIELNENTDFFNTLEKAKLIKGFIESYTPNMTHNKIMALYGEWGSGKSSILKYIKNELPKENFSTLYFNSWEYEKDRNLALSLFDALYCEAESKKIKLVGLREKAFRVLGAIGKGFTLSTPIGDFSIKDMLENIENTEKSSYYKEVKNFKGSFIDLENAILEKETGKRLVVFLDDLDRCEPENILDLLSAIKLFFTLGSNRIMFVCGVDKEAVHKALLIKYDDKIKANEYLEKIFDFTFNMPNSFDLEKALSISLKEYNNDSPDFNYLMENVANMFKAIEFTNPRHIKKIINKYIIFRYFSKNSELVDKYDILKNLKIEKENLFFLLIFFYLIVLYEFDKEAFNSTEFNNKKISNLKDKHLEGKIEISRIKGGSGAGDKWAICNSIENLKKKILEDKVSLSNPKNHVNSMKFIIYFLPVLEMPFLFLDEAEQTLRELENIAHTKEYKFIKFIIDNKNTYHNCEFSLQILRNTIDILS